MKYFDGKQFSNPGDPIHIIYAPQINVDGTFDLVESGRENTDDIINSHRDSTDMSIIIARIKAGDLEALNKSTPMYGDFTQMPTTLAESLQMKIDADRMYDSLTVEQKQKFDNDKNKFFASAGTDEWFEKIGIAREIKNEEVKEGSEE